VVVNKDKIEFSLVLLLSRFPYDETVEQKIRKILTIHNIDWDFFFQLVVGQKIALLIYHRIQLFLEHIPKSEFLVFKENCSRQIFLNLKNINELKKIYQKAEDRNIEIIPYKGFVFAEEVYGSFSLRYSSDIDFWYNIKDTKHLEAIFTEEGYSPTIKFNRFQKKLFPKVNCEYHFVKKMDKQRVLFEPHHSWINHFLKIKPSVEDVEKHTTVFKGNNLNFKTFSPELTLVYLVLHHGITENWSFIKNHADLVAFVNKYYDANWEDFLVVCEKYEVKKAFLVGVESIKKLFDFSLPEVLNKELKKDKDISKLSELCLSEKRYLPVYLRQRTLFKIYFIWKTRANFLQKIQLLGRIILYSFYRLVFAISMIIK
jgi:hypothetical protein